MAWCLSSRPCAKKAAWVCDKHLLDVLARHTAFRQSGNDQARDCLRSGAGGSCCCCSASPCRVAASLCVTSGAPGGWRCRSCSAYRALDWLPLCQDVIAALVLGCWLAGPGSGLSEEPAAGRAGSLAAVG